MARNGSGVYSKPVGVTAVANTPIRSAQFNGAIDDLVEDANTPRPIVAGGTGSESAAGARSNLGLGTMALQDKTDVSIEGGTIIVSDIRIGKTSVDISDSGVRIADDGQIDATVIGDVVMRVNRKTDDGDLIRLHRSDAVVGAIRALSGGVALDSDADMLIDATNVVITTGATGRVALTTSGDFRVTKTTADLTDTGINLNYDGQIDATVIGDVVARLNRKTSDGDVLRIYRSDAIVGAIGAVSGGMSVDSDAVLALIATTSATMEVNGSVRTTWSNGGDLRHVKTTTDIDDIGVNLNSTGLLDVTVAGATVARFNRKNNDGTIIDFLRSSSSVGSISVASGVVTYGSFCGVHVTQGLPADILRGTIVETTDEMCVWDGVADEVLPKGKPARAGSISVYGCFSHWDENGDPNVAALGANLVRIAPGVEVKRGDLIESAGDGMGRVQRGITFKAATVAKVTASVVIETFPDGSYLVPATIHCG